MVILDIDRRNTTNHSIITDHRLSFNYEFKWDEVEILDKEPVLNKQLISEMINMS